MDGCFWLTALAYQLILSRHAITAGHRPFRLQMILVLDSTAVVVQAAQAVHFTAAVRVVRGEEANSVFDDSSHGFPDSFG